MNIRTGTNLCAVALAVVAITVAVLLFASNSVVGDNQAYAYYAYYAYFHHWWHHYWWHPWMHYRW